MNKRWRTWLVATVLVMVVTWMLLGLPILFYPLGVAPKLLDYAPSLDPKPCAEIREVKLEGSTLFISDLHLTADEEGGASAADRFSGLAQFITSRSVENLVIVGDLFDSPKHARRILGSSDNEAATRIIMDRMGLNRGPLQVFFVKGSAAHDPADFNLDFKSENLSFTTLGRCARFAEGSVKVTTIHGDAAYGGAHGFIFAYLTGRPYLEAWWKETMKIDSEEWVVMAHSHVPNIDYTRRVANTGGWTHLLGLGPPRGRGILLANEEITLVTIRN